MYINIYSCTDWAYSGDDTAGAKASNCNKHFKPTPVGAIFFVMFVFLGALVLLTLFVGVVTTSMEEAQGAQNEEVGAEKLKKEYCDGGKIIPVKCCDVFFSAFEIVKPSEKSKVPLIDLQLILETGSFGLESFEETKALL